MSFLSRVLEEPKYGFEYEGSFYRPDTREIWKEFFSRLNVLRTRKNWLPLWTWSTTILLSVPLILFILHERSLTLALVGFCYGAFVLGTHGTLYLHRYSTHRAFQIRNRVWLFFIRNAVIKLIPEETYVVSHHVHHWIPDRAGDPYNAHGGFLYCFLADVNHQLIARNLSQPDYSRVAKLLAHTGVKINSYEQYLKWGSLSHPLRTMTHFLLNWVFWYGAFYLLGGNALAMAIFGSAFLWALGVRTFNYEGHGKGKDRRKPGIDFNQKDLSVNQLWPGYVAGEWHNNHHLYPSSARSGFLPYQLDLAWISIRGLSRLGGIVGYRDDRENFFRDHYEPYLSSINQT